MYLRRFVIFAISAASLISPVAGDARTSTVARTAASKPATARVSATKQIVLAVERLAGDETRASVGFAVKLTTVVAKHKVALPEGLRRLAAPRPPIPKPTAAEVSRMYRQTHRIFTTCVESTRTKVVHSGVSVALRNDLLMTVARHCPSSLARVEAVDFLGKRAVPSGGSSGVPDVSPAEVSKAFETVIMHVLDVSSGNLGPDSILAIRWAESFGLCPYSVHLKAITIDKPTKDALDKYVAAIDAKVAAAQKVVRGESARKTLERFREQVKRVGSGTKLIAQVASLRNEVRPVVQAFFDAANKEDFAAARKLMTKKTAARLPKDKPSLRALIANSPNVKEVRFVSLGALGTIGSQYRVPVHILIVGANGKSRPGVWNAYLTKTDAGWRFGE